jgi:hypothetical protein
MNETEQGKEMTQEEYKARLLKQNFAQRVVSYEDVIAELQTQLAMLQQQLQVLEAREVAAAPAETPVSLED